jgi:phosphoribosylformylglycinamidine synthase I
MAATPKALVLRAAGTNCDAETAHSFDLAGAAGEVAHVNRLADGSIKLADYQLLAIPGGFSYGDDLGAGKVFALELEHRLGGELKEFVDRGGLVIGICNGFQVLVKTGILPGNPGYAVGEAVTLAQNDSQKYEDRWVTLEVQDTSCAWLPRERALIEMPVAHGEGKFIPASAEVLSTLKANKQIVVRYVKPDGSEAAYPANPNGAVEGVAGITDLSGRVFGLMPHPERYIFHRQHPRWTRGEGRDPGDGRAIFENAVKYLS